MTGSYFAKPTFTFLSSLAANNNREWFEANKQKYEDYVRTPALNFIADMALELPAISKHFRAVPKKMGGSLMRVQRDTRFSHDKSPYKTNIGIQFRHELGKDVHAPGFYVHIEPGECFVGAGLWRPEADMLFRIRDGIVNNSEAWVVARDNKDFRKHFTLGGDALVNAPRGLAKNHPLLEDLKRKDFVAIAPLKQTDVTAKDFRERVVERFKQADPLMRFLCGVLELSY